MTEIEFQGRKYRVDEDGFLESDETWTPEWAEFIAKIEGLNKITQDHWKVINFVRNYYIEFGKPPIVRTLLKKTGFNIRQIKELFPIGLVKGIYKVAGLASIIIPTGCL